MPNSGYFDVAFGEDGVLTSVPDGVQSDGSVSYTQGWGPDYELEPGTSGALYPTIGTMNQIFNDITTALQQYQQNGIPPFITSSMNNGSPFSYAQYAMVLYDGVAYQSNVSGNTDTPPSSKWNAVNLNSTNVFTGGTTTGSANAQVLASLSPASGFSMSNNGQTIVCTAGFTNTGATTLGITSLGLSGIAIKKLSGMSVVPLSGGEIVDTDTINLVVNTANNCLILQSSLALGAMAQLNIGNNMANDTNGNAVATVPPLALTGTNKTYQLGQWGAQIARSNSGTTMADTIPGTSGALPAGWYVEIQNTDATAALQESVGSGGTLTMGNQNISSGGFVIEPGETYGLFSQGAGAYVIQRVSTATLHAGVPVGDFANLTAAWTSDTTATVTAAALVVQDSAGNTRRLTGVNQAFNTAASVGTNTGLDTGSLAANTWYYGYVTYNPATNAQGCIFSASPSGPTLPSGYTMSALATVFRTDGSSNLIGYAQKNYDWQYVVGHNLSNTPPMLWSGTTGTFGSAWANVNITSVCPPIVGKIDISQTTTSGSSNQSQIAPNGNWSSSTPYAGVAGVAGLSNHCEMVVENTTIAVQAEANNEGYVTGFTLNF